jgi:hypothetical protein
MLVPSPTRRAISSSKELGRSGIGGDPELAWKVTLLDIGA